MKIRSTAVGAAAAAAALAATLVPHPNATASAHPAARWSATWASAMQSPVPGNDTTDPKGPNWSDGFSNQTVRQVIRVSGGGTRNTVVTFGDSITNGHNSTVGGNDRYPDALAGSGATLSVSPESERSSSVKGPTTSGTAKGSSAAAARPRGSPRTSSSPGTRR